MHDTDNPRRLARAAPLAIALAIALFGCYTVLKHPITSEEGPQGQVDHSQAYYRQNCVDCHADYSEYPYGYFYGTYPEYYFEYPRWGYYYAYPWWWDYGWYDGQSAPQDESLSETPASAKASRRGGMVPPYVDRAPAVWDNSTSTAGGYRTPSAGSATGKAGETSGTGAAGSGSGGEKTRVRIGAQPSADSTAGTTEKQTDQKKADRRGGTPPPK
jgi:hypothetical protein